MSYCRIVWSLGRLVTIAICAVQSEALADPPAARVRVDVYSSSGVATTYHNPGQQIAIAVNSSTVRIHAYSDRSDDRPLTDIGRIILSGTLPNTLLVHVDASTTGFAQDGAKQPAGGLDWGGIATPSPENVHLTCSISGDLVGSVDTGQIWRMDIDGQVQEPVTGYASGSGTLHGWIFVGEVLEDAPIFLYGAIRVLDVAGDLDAAAVSHLKHIREVNIGGDIGVNAGLWSRDWIGAVRVAGSVYGDIDTAYFEVYDNIQTLEIGGDIAAGAYVRVTEVDDFGVSGATPGIRIAGDFNGRMDVVGGLDYDMIVEGGFGDDSLILLEPTGLRSQITFNNSNNSSMWGDDAIVQVGFTGSIHELDEPYYLDKPSDLGGGSVGLAPFNMHGSGCDPEDGESLELPAGLLINGICLDQCDAETYELDYVIVRHYGPVEWSSGNPVTVKRRSLLCGGSATWTNVTNQFTFAINADSGDREIKVSYTGSSDWPIDYEYLIEPVAGVLRCKGVNGSPDVHDYDYNFSLVAECGELFMSMYDRNHDDSLTSTDIVAWSVEPADLNGDSAIDGNDLERLWDVVMIYGQ